MIVVIVPAVFYSEVDVLIRCIHFLTVILRMDREIHRDEELLAFLQRKMLYKRRNPYLIYSRIFTTISPATIFPFRFYETLLMMADNLRRTI